LEVGSRPAPGSPAARPPPLSGPGGGAGSGKWRGTCAGTPTRPGPGAGANWSNMVKMRSGSDGAGIRVLDFIDPIIG
jgi:hypothetical protein